MKRDRTKKKLTLCCIASGDGSDFEAIAKSWKSGGLPEIEEIFLISTNADAGCISKAKKHRIKWKFLLSQGVWLTYDDLQKTYDEMGGIDLTFLVGCTKMAGAAAPTYNIHPADPEKHGGRGMYGLIVHIHVLENILDQIKRGITPIKSSRFFTYPTIHEASLEYDKGKPLLRASVEIPNQLIDDLLNKRCHIEDAAKRLQQIVLPFEHLMLPAAVQMAAKKILDERRK